MVNIKQSNGVLATGREQTNLEGILREILLRYLRDQEKSREPWREVRAEDWHNLHQDKELAQSWEPLTNICCSFKS